MKNVLILVLLLACSSISYAQSKVANDTSVKAVAIKFLKWYFGKEIDTSLNAKRDTAIIHEDIVTPENGKPYRVNFKVARNYMLFLKSSRMLSDYYLKELEKYFVRCDSNFVKYPQTFHVPHGFEFDFVLKSIDYDNIENNVDNSVIALYERKRNKVNMKLDFIIKNSASNRVESYTFQLSKHNSKWLIDKINGDFPEEIDHHEISWPKN